MAFLSLAVPWWTFVLLNGGNVASSFNLFLFGVSKSGFMRADLSFEWWSYATFAVVAFGTCLGLVGYRFLVLDRKNARKLVALDIAFMVGACILYLTGLAYAFATSLTSFQSYWMTSPTENLGQIAIARLNVFGVRSVNFLGNGVVVLEFLSVGFLFAVISILLLTAAYGLPRKLPQPNRIQPAEKSTRKT